MIYQNMLVVQQADFEKINYLHDFILCILALHGFASKITTICFNSESVTANKNLLNVCSGWEVRQLYDRPVLLISRASVVMSRVEG